MILLRAHSSQYCSLLLIILLNSYVPQDGNLDSPTPATEPTLSHHISQGSKCLRQMPKGLLG